MRSKMVKIADTYFFKEMSGDELAREMANAVKVIPSLSSMDEVSELMANEQNSMLPESGLQWRIWIVPNFRADESLVIYKVHHVVGDGLAQMIMVAGLQDDYSPE